MKSTRLEPVYNRFSLLVPSLFLVVCLLYAYLAFPNMPAYFLASPLVYFLAAFAVFVLQELTFLLAAKLLGFGPYAVYLGVGRARGAGSLLGTRFGWSSLSPIVSYWLGSTSPRAFRLRLFLLSMVRPLVLLAALACLSLASMHLPALLPTWANTNTLPLLLGAAVLAVVVELLRVCWASKRFDATGGRMFSNRYLLRKALWLNPAKLRSNIEHAYSLETNLLISEKKYAEAKQKLFSAIDTYPDSLALRKSLILVAFYVGDYPSARKHAQQLLQLPTLTPTERFTLHYQAACAALMSGELEAARQEAEVLRVASPEYMPTQCLLGALDIQQGRPAQGAAIIEKVLAQDKSIEVQAECYAWLSIAASKQGDPKRAEELLRQAQQLQSREQTVQLAYQELQEAKLQEHAARTTPYRA